MVDEGAPPVGDILNVLHCDTMKVEEEPKRRGTQLDVFGISLYLLVYASLAQSDVL